MRKNIKDNNKSKEYFKNTDNRFLHKLFRKAEISYTVSDITKAIGPMIGTMFIGKHIGTDGLTVMGYVAPLIMLFELIGTAVSSGSRNKVSSLIGAGELEEADRAFSASVITGACLSLFSAFLVFVFCSFVSLTLGARDPLIHEATMQYIYGYLIGFPFFTMTRILTPYLQMEGQYRRVNAVSILTTLIDIIGDVFVIFVLHGGMFGIGLVTSLGYVVPFFVDAAFFAGRKNRSAFRFTLNGFSLKRCAEILRLGAPAGIVKGSNSLGGVAINNMLTSMNQMYLVAAYGVFSQITVFFRSSWYAPADTLHAFAGVFIGEEDKDSLKEIQKTSLYHALIYTGIVTVFLFSSADYLASVFLKSGDPQGLRLTAECIRVSCLSLPFHSIVYNFNNYLMSAKKLRFCSFYSFLIECGTFVPTTFLLLRIMGYHGAWASKPANTLILSLIAILYVSLQEGRAFRDKMLLLPESFGISKEDELAMTASSAADIEDLSHLAVAFALDHGADKKRALTYGLITEELSAVLKDHSFADGKPHNINARLVAKDGDLIVRVRDDCKPFNLTEYYELIRDEQDKEKEISLSIIMKMAKDVKYTAAFGANNLIIRF
jgi:Na+-driven multidrug efflux pump